jgi:hypothetical protein
VCKIYCPIPMWMFTQSKEISAFVSFIGSVNISCCENIQTPTVDLGGHGRVLMRLASLRQESGDDEEAVVQSFRH